MASDVWLEIHLTELDVENQGVSLDALSDTLRAFLNLTYLVSAAFLNPRVPFADVRVLRKEFFDSFNLKCEVLKPGSLNTPIILAPRTDPVTLFSDDEALNALGEFKVFFDDTIQATTSANLDRMMERVPIRNNVRRVVDAVTTLVPSGDCGLELRRDSPRGPSIYSSERDQQVVREFAKSLKIEDSKPIPAPKELTLIAEVSAIDFEDGVFDASTSNGLKIRSDLHENVKNGDTLFEAPHVEIDGTYKVNEEGEVLGLVDEKEIRLIDTTPIEVSDLQVRNEHLRVDPPLEFIVEFDKDASCYTVEGDFEIYLYAFSRGELKSSLFELLEIMWLDYAQEDDEGKLAPGGKQLKQDLLNRIRRV
ncbi:MAG: hypothetical protein OXG05_13385 [Gammaproteobacteria bacterium]|nr:hypothetical protein [Gammaproteobacteria bacterium]